MSSGFRFRP